MSLGRPAVVTSTGGITELVSHEESGLVVPPKRPALLADAVSRLLDDAGIRGRLGASAKRRFDERCAAHVTTPILEQMFSRIAVSGRQPRSLTQAAR
jgi:hypothetical protein